jgi:hypothetical protein
MVLLATLFPSRSTSDLERAAKLAVDELATEPVAVAAS